MSVPVKSNNKYLTINIKIKNSYKNELHYVHLCVLHQRVPRTISVFFSSSNYEFKIDYRVWCLYVCICITMESQKILGEEDFSNKKQILYVSSNIIFFID